MALFSNTAATEESTPPDKPNTTLSFPIFSLSWATVESINESGVQICWQPQIFTTNDSDRGLGKNRSMQTRKKN